MTNSKYSNDQTTDIVARSQGFDEGYAAGIKEGISMAIEALPERLSQIDAAERGWLDFEYIAHNKVLNQAKSNLLKLKKG